MEFTLLGLKQYMNQNCYNNINFIIGDVIYPQADEVLSLQFDGKKYNVFYFERGIRNLYKTFDSEYEACSYFFKEMTSSNIGLQHLVATFDNRDEAIIYCERLKTHNIQYSPFRYREDEIRIYVYGCDIKLAIDIKNNIAN